MQQIALALHLIIAFLILALILVQRGKGSDIGAAFGSGASQTVFGSQGSTSFLVKVIGFLIALFFASSLLLNVIVAHSLKEEKIASTPDVLLQQQQHQQEKQQPTNNK
jgi:preprotein translocase subunit SecG